MRKSKISRDTEGRGTQGWSEPAKIRALWFCCSASSLKTLSLLRVISCQLKATAAIWAQKSQKEPKRDFATTLNTTGMSLDRVLSQIVPVSLISSFEILRGRLDSWGEEGNRTHHKHILTSWHMSWHMAHIMSGLSGISSYYAPWISPRGALPPIFAIRQRHWLPLQPQLQNGVNTLFFRGWRKVQTSATSVVFDSNKLQEVTESNTLWSVVCACPCNRVARMAPLASCFCAWAAWPWKLLDPACLGNKTWKTC